MNFIALDLGTSFIKGCVLDLDRLRLTHIRRQAVPDPLAGRPALFYEIAPQALVTATRTLISELLALAPDCQGIVLCTQMHGLVLCSPQGQPLSNAITWQDQRVLTPHPSGETYLARLLAQTSAEDRMKLGNELQPSRPICYLYWLAEQGLLPNEPAIPAALPDFVLANLSGSAPSIELTNAGATSALDHTTLDWHRPLIERLGLGELQWPQIRPFGAVAAVITVDGQQLPCYTPVGDHQCALVGAFLAGNELSLNIATGSQVSLITPQLQFGQCQTRPFFDGRFLNTITGVPAGRALNVLMNLLTELARAQQVTLADPWGYVSSAAEQVEQSDLAVNLAFYESMGGKEGSIHHIREDNLAAGQLFHAAFQNMADNYLLAAQQIAALPGTQQLVFSGGLAQKIGVLRAMIQRKFGLPSRVCASAEDALLGLLALALVASGRFARVGQATDYLLANYRE